jgi:hydrogenase-4 component E
MIALPPGLSPTQTEATTVAVQLLATATSALLLTAVLLLWRRSITGAAGVLAAQGVAVALLSVAAGEGSDTGTYAVAALLLLVKGVLIPALVLRTARSMPTGPEAPSSINPTTGVLLAALLTTLAFLVAGPVVAGSGRATATAIPVGLAVVLIGFLDVATRRHLLAQVVGFVMVDNGIGATAVLASGGLPVVIELGVLFDALLVVLILLVLAGRIRTTVGTVDLAQLDELRD